MPHFSECICVLRRHFALCVWQFAMHAQLRVLSGSFSLQICVLPLKASPSRGRVVVPRLTPTTTTAPTADPRELRPHRTAKEPSTTCRRWTARLAAARPTGAIQKNRIILWKQTCFLVERPNQVKHLFANSLARPANSLSNNPCGLSSLSQRMQTSPSHDMNRCGCSGSAPRLQPAPGGRRTRSSSQSAEVCRSLPVEAGRILTWKSWARCHSKMG